MRTFDPRWEGTKETRFSDEELSQFLNSLAFGLVILDGYEVDVLSGYASPLSDLPIETLTSEIAAAARNGLFSRGPALCPDWLFPNGQMTVVRSFDQLLDREATLSLLSGWLKEVSMRSLIILTGEYLEPLQEKFPFAQYFKLYD